MKKLLRVLGLFLLSAVPSFAQTFVQSGVQPIGVPATSYTFTFKQPNTAPCTLFISARSWSLTIQDGNNNVWAKAPGHNGLYYTTTCNSGSDTITIPFANPTYLQAVFAEYSGVLTPDQASTSASASSTQAISPTVNALAGDLLLGIGWNESSNSIQATPGIGFAMRGDTNAFLEDSIQPTTGPATSSVSYPINEIWMQAIAAFQVSVPPPPPPAKINLSVTGSILFDDQTVVYVGAITPNQFCSNTSTWVQAGSINSDAGGNLTGAFIIDPSCVDANNNVVFQLTLPGITNMGLPTVPLIRFQQGSTSLAVNEVLFKTPFMTKLLAVEKASSVVLLP
jgi:hypothetical protein